MLLKLIPARQEPTIHFSLSFAELPSNVPAPPSWTAQLSHLMREDLEVPATLHSLDRAAGIPSLLEEVALDVEMKEVRCRFIDGAVERFAFDLNGEVQGDKLMEALEGIIRVVKESSMEDERIANDQLQERERQRSRSMSVSAAAPASVSKPPGKLGKHKKQRSLFMHLVSCVGSIVNLTSPSTSSFSRSSLKAPILPSESSPSSSFTEVSSASSSASGHSQVAFTAPMPGTSPRARVLRRAARSALVDTFRQFVIGELATRFYIGPDHENICRQTNEASNHPNGYRYAYHHQRERGGFCVWILHSMRRRALERMEQILEEAGSAGQVISFVQDVHPRSIRFSEDSDANELRPTTMDVPLSFSDEEDEGDETQSGVIAPFDANADSESDASETTVDGDTSESASTVYPKRPGGLCRRTSSSDSSDSVSTDGSSHSTSTTSSHDSTSTDATSVESESSTKETESLPPLPKDSVIPASQEPRQQQIIPSANGFKEINHPPMHHLSLAAQHEYSQLLELRIRLGQLVRFAESQTRVAAEEARNRLEMLAVRSRRRAWLNKALKTPVGGGSLYGFATPFRTSPLATYMWTAEDLARRTSAISRGSTSSTSSLSSSYFRSVSSSSSASSSLSKGSSSRPRLRPRIDYEAALAAAVMELDQKNFAEAECPNSVDVTDALLEDDYEQEQSKAADCEFEMYEEVHGPTRARRHHRRRMQDTPSVASVPQGGKLFPVSEESDEFALAIRGRGRARCQDAAKASRTFMGCDEIRMERFGDDEDTEEQQHQELGFGFPLQMYPHHKRTSMQNRDTTLPTDIDMEHLKVESEMGTNFAAIDTEPSKIRPRARTNSMIGVILRSAKGVQKTFAGASKQQQPRILSQLRSPSSPNLPGDSLLCQPVAVSNPPSSSTSSDAPLPVHAPNRRAAEVSRTPASAIYTNIEVGLDMEMDIQIRVGDAESLPLSFPMPLPSKLASHPNIEVPCSEFDIVEQSANLPHSQDQEEFTLAMDVPRVTGRKRPGYQTKHRSSLIDYDGNRRPKLDDIFGDSINAPSSAC